jgi:hypothetical protein
MGAVEPPDEDVGVAGLVCGERSFVGIGARSDVVVEALEDVLDDFADDLVERESDPTLVDDGWRRHF